MLKGESSEWINLNKLTGDHLVFGKMGMVHFHIPVSMVNVVANYIENQEQHHKKKSSLTNIRNSSMNLVLNMMTDTFLSCQNNLNSLAPTGQVLSFHISLLPTFSPYGALKLLAQKNMLQTILTIAKRLVASCPCVTITPF